MKILMFVLSVTSISFANFDIAKAGNEGISAGLSSVGGWLVLGVLIAIVFAVITRGRKK